VVTLRFGFLFGFGDWRRFVFGSWLRFLLAPFFDTGADPDIQVLTVHKELDRFVAVRTHAVLRTV
jgi:hypothetical protein